MRFRLGLFSGLAIGYVLGAKAGTERYDQIKSAAAALRGSDPGQQIETEVRDAAHRVGQVAEDKAGQGVAKVTELVHGAADSINSGTRSR